MAEIDAAAAGGAKLDVLSNAKDSKNAELENALKELPSPMKRDDGQVQSAATTIDQALLPDGTPAALSMIQGRVKTFSTRKGFGFITSEELVKSTTGDVFLFNTHLVGRIGLVPGEKVEFTLFYDPNTLRPQARNVRVIEQAPSAMGPGATSSDFPATAEGIERVRKLKEEALARAENLRRGPAAGAGYPTSMPVPQAQFYDTNSTGTTTESQQAEPAARPLPTIEKPVLDMTQKIREAQDEAKKNLASEQMNAWQHKYSPIGTPGSGASGTVFYNPPVAPLHSREKPIPDGSTVTIIDFPINELNGLSGEIKSFDSHSRRYRVEVMDPKKGKQEFLMAKEKLQINRISIPSKPPTPISAESLSSASSPLQQALQSVGQLKGAAAAKLPQNVKGGLGSPMQGASIGGLPVPPPPLMLSGAKGAMPHVGANPHLLAAQAAHARMTSLQAAATAAAAAQRKGAAVSNAMAGLAAAQGQKGTFAGNVLAGQMGNPGAALTFQALAASAAGKGAAVPTISSPVGEANPAGYLSSKGGHFGHAKGASVAQVPVNAAPTAQIPPSRPSQVKRNTSLPNITDVGKPWYVRAEDGFDVAIVREQLDINSREIAQLRPGDKVVQRGPVVCVPPGVTRMPIEKPVMGWVTAHARDIGGPTFLDDEETHLSRQRAAKKREEEERQAKEDADNMLAQQSVYGDVPGLNLAKRQYPLFFLLRFKLAVSPLEESHPVSGIQVGKLPEQQRRRGEGMRHRDREAREKDRERRHQERRSRRGEDVEGLKGPTTEPIAETAGCGGEGVISQQYTPAAGPDASVAAAPRAGVEVPTITSDQQEKSQSLSATANYASLSAAQNAAVPAADAKPPTVETQQDGKGQDGACMQQ